MATAATTQQNVAIPDRLYFRIGDVCRLTGLRAHVLRYWESEFPSLAPKKSGTNQRLYRRKDVELVLEIKRLLYDQKFTIEGARSYLQQRKSAPKPAPDAGSERQAMLFDTRAEWAEAGRAIRSELIAIVKLLDSREH